VVSRDGYFDAKIDEDAPQHLATGRRRIGKGEGLPLPPPAVPQIPGELQNLPGEKPVPTRRIMAIDFTAREVEQAPEELCECPYCGQAYHDRCVRFSKEVYGPVPPRCIRPACQKRWREVPKPEPHARFLSHRARDIATTPITRFIQGYVEGTVFSARAERGAAAKATRRGEDGDDPGVLVRLMSCVRRQQKSTPAFTSKFGQKIFPYTLKTYMCFIECADGADVACLALVVAEFGPDAPEPNRNKAYISYIDSVHLYHKCSCAMRAAGPVCAATCSDPAGCAAERKEVVRRVILGYLDSVRRRDFEATYIWAMPPSDLHHDYVFHMRPLQQHCPTPPQLDSWYTKLLNIALKAGIVAGFDSNAQEEGGSAQDRTLPPSLFGPDMSLRHVPQFPGGLMPRVLEAALAGDSNLTLSSPEARRSSLASPEAGGTERRDPGTTRARAMSRETALQSRERHQRAVEAMNKYLQKHSVPFPPLSSRRRVGSTAWRGLTQARVPSGTGFRVDLRDPVSSRKGRKDSGEGRCCRQGCAGALVSWAGWSGGRGEPGRRSARVSG